MIVTDENARSARRSTRRQELIEAAAAVFSTKGVSASSVDDIVRAAGVAKGTFYLYFATKDDAVNAVAASMVEGVAARIETAAADAARSPVERLLAFGQGLRDVGDEPYERELIEIFHRPQNRQLHDRIGELAVSRLSPAVATIIADGIEQGHFQEQDPRRAAAYVMASFSSLHDVVAAPSDLPRAVEELDAFVLRGLGYVGSVPA